MFGRVDLTFEHYLTAETLMNNYLVVLNMFLETVEFRDPRTVSQIDTCLVNLNYRTYPITLKIRYIISVIIHFGNRYY